MEEFSPQTKRSTYSDPHLNHRGERIPPESNLTGISVPENQEERGQELPSLLCWMIISFI